MKNLGQALLIALAPASLLVIAVAAQTPELRKGVSVQMAAARNGAAIPEADLADSLIITVTRSGDIYDGVTPSASAELAARIKSYITGRADKKLYIKGDARVPYESVSAVLSGAHSAGATSATLAIEQTYVRSTRTPIPRPPMGIEVQAGPSAPGAPGALSLGAQASAQGLVVVFAGRRVSVDALEGAIKQSVQGRSNITVAITADPKLAFGDVVRLIDACRAAGVKVFLVAPGS